MLKYNMVMRFSALSFFVLLVSGSCTDLTESPYDLVTPDNFYGTEAELTAAVVPVYNSLALADFSNFAHLREVSSDELVVPTRGGDWDDGGVWRELQLHTWTVTSGFVSNGWSDPYGGIARANSTLDNLGRAEQTTLVKTYTAEVKVLRALFYWWLLDLFGGVPIVTAAETDLDNPPARNTATEVFDFIVAQIAEALPDLEATHGAAGYGRVTTGAANTLLATVNLNAGVYTGTAKWTETLAAANAVISSGLYDLMPTVEDVFSFANEGVANTEYILVTATLPLDGVSSGERHQASLHYNQLPSSPWNGFSVLTDFYNEYDSADDRLDQILVGQQYVLGGAAVGDSALDRDGAPLIFQVTFNLLTATERDGPRILKWPIDPNQSGWFSGVDFAIFRYSHVLLMKAEAEFNLSGGGLASLNLVHERAGLPALSAITSKAIYDERGFEFLWEGFRRMDQIRHGTFLDAYTLKPDVTDAFRLLFPIPQSQLDANPSLVQNPGY